MAFVKRVRVSGKTRKPGTEADEPFFEVASERIPAPSPFSAREEAESLARWQQERRRQTSPIAPATGDLSTIGALAAALLGLGVAERFARWQAETHGDGAGGDEALSLADGGGFSPTLPPELILGSGGGWQAAQGAVGGGTASEGTGAAVLGPFRYMPGSGSLVAADLAFLGDAILVHRAAAAQPGLAVATAAQVGATESAELKAPPAAARGETSGTETPVAATPRQAVPEQQRAAEAAPANVAVDVSRPAPAAEASFAQDPAAPAAVITSVTAESLAQQAIASAPAVTETESFERPAEGREATKAAAPDPAEATVAQAHDAPGSADPIDRLFATLAPSAELDNLGGAPGLPTTDPSPLVAGDSTPRGNAGRDRPGVTNDDAAPVLASSKGRDAPSDTAGDKAPGNSAEHGGHGSDGDIATPVKPGATGAAAPILASNGNGKADDNGKHNGQGNDNDQAPILASNGNGKPDDNGKHNGQGNDNDNAPVLASNGNGKSDGNGKHDGQGNDNAPVLASNGNGKSGEDAGHGGHGHGDDHAPVLASIGDGITAAIDPVHMALMQLATEATDHAAASDPAPVLATAELLSLPNDRIL